MLEAAGVQLLSAGIDENPHAYKDINEVMKQRIAALGEPWLSTFDPTHLQRQLLELGFGTAESATPEDLNARYFARRKDGLRMGGGIRIMCANK